MKAKQFLFSLLFLCIALFAMGGCTNHTVGQFAWLDCAYESGWLTHEDLDRIATLSNDDQTESASALDSKIQENIKTAYCQKMNLEEFYDSVGISLYYGTFGDCFVIAIASDCAHGGGDPIYYEEYEIDGVTFYDYSPLGVYKQTVV